MTCLVVGGTGFVGRHLVSSLRREGPEEVVTVDRSTGDIASPGIADALIRRLAPSTVICLAGAASGSVEDLCRANVWGPLALILAVGRHASTARVIVTGSASEYGNAPGGELPVTEKTRCAPAGAHGTTKLAGTVSALRMATELGVSVSVVRPFNIVGAGVPDSLVVGALIQRILRAAPGDSIKVGRTDTQRDFIAVEDVVDAIRGLVPLRPAPDVYNISGGVPVAIGDVLNMLSEISGRAVRFETDPALVRPDDVPVSYGSYAKLNALTGFKPKHTLRAALCAAWQAAAARQATAA